MTQRPDPQPQKRMEPVPASLSSAGNPSIDRPAAAAVALRTAVYYLVFGLLWIVSTDRLLELLWPDQAHKFQTPKGFLFIFLTALLLFLVVRHFVRALQRTQEEMRQKVEGIAAQYQLLFQRSPSSMVIFEQPSLRILAANDVSLLQFGYSRDELLGMTIYDLVLEHERPRAAAETAKSQSAVRNAGVWQVRRRDGRIIHVDVMSHQVEFNGQAARIAMTTDVTERLQVERSLAQYRTQLEQRVTERTAELSHANRMLRAEVQVRQGVEEELRAATSAAESANEAKSTFLANTSHEIRTPLTSILGYADLLADEDLSLEERAKYLDIVRQNAQHLLALIDDLLDLSRAEMGKVRLTLDEQSPREIAQQALELLRPRAVEKNLEMTLQVAAGVPDFIPTDGVRLRQILLNLMGNAIKFTPQGSVTLTVEVAPAPDDVLDGVQSLWFEVEDTGIGMTQDQQSRIFEPFYQVEQGNTRRFGGSGLGLPISLQLARQLGGELLVKSEADVGSTFSLVLPLRLGTKAASVAVPGYFPQMLSGHILLAEDNPNIRLLVDEYLLRAGARVTTVVNGAEAVQRVREAMSSHAVEGQAFDLVLLDLHMPMLDGAQAKEQIRDLGFKGPVVGLTADYAEKTPEEWGREGWDAMAAKPIDRQAFIPLLARMMTPERV